MKRILAQALVGGALALASFGGIAQAATPAQSAPVVEHRGPKDGRPLLAGSLIKQTATTTGLTRVEVVEQLKAGKSLTQIAESKGKTAAEIIAAVRTELKAHLDKAVQNQRITQARADEMLANFDTNAPTVMNDTTLGQKIAERQDRPRGGKPANTP
jgi:hypothetical protein